MKKIFLLTAVTLLSACVSTTQTQNAQIPAQIEHEGQIYHLANQKDLGEMQRYFYLRQGETTKNWQSAVEILRDLNSNQTLAQRIELRKKVYKNNELENFELEEKQGSLYSYVIYPPNDKENNWQIEVAKGKNTEYCGFAQFQYSLKVDKTAKLAKMNKDKLLSYLKKYAIDKEMSYLNQLNWNCVPFESKTP